MCFCKIFVGIREEAVVLLVYKGKQVSPLSLVPQRWSSRYLWGLCVIGFTQEGALGKLSYSAKASKRRK